MNRSNFSRRSRPGDEISFVCCVESGVLEAMGLRLVESLRRFGGRFASSKVVVVTPRFGPPLNSSTRSTLERLEVDYLRVPSNNRFSWFHFLNKHVALMHAEDRVTTELIAYLDSDTLFLGEPEAFELSQDVDFAAMTSDVTVGATTGPDDPNDSAWQAICGVAGVSVDDLPWITTHLDHARIRLYFQGGVYVYRREVGFGRKMQVLLTSVLERKVRLPGSAWTFLEQALPGPLVVKNGFRWKELPFSHNYTMSRYLPEFDEPESLRRARLVHYHDSMGPDSWSAFLERLAAGHAEVADWLRPLGPVANVATPPWRALNEILRVQRGARRRAHDRSIQRAATHH